jgi:hypothetical protein
MPVENALIHEFDAKQPPRFDIDGELLLGFYYQFVDHNDLPVYGLIGPYRHRFEAEGAAQVAFDRKDY